MPLSKSELQILQHALGVDEYGRGEQYRHHFVTHPDGEDGRVCEGLTALGYMFRHDRMGELTGGIPCYFVTPKGREAVRLESPATPPPVRLTRSQKRYRRFLNADSGLSLREWLKVDARRPAFS
jgi:hypothetical protein